METVNQVWKGLVRETICLKNIDRLNFITELPNRIVLNFLVKQGIAIDTKGAQMVVDNFLGGVKTCEGIITQNEFSKLFLKGIFK